MSAKQESSALEYLRIIHEHYLKSVTSCCSPHGVPETGWSADLCAWSFYLANFDPGNSQSLAHSSSQYLVDTEALCDTLPGIQILLPCAVRSADVADPTKGSILQTCLFLEHHLWGIWVGVNTSETSKWQGPGHTPLLLGV